MANATDLLAEMPNIEKTDIRAAKDVKSSFVVFEAARQGRLYILNRPNAILLQINLTQGDK